MNKKTVFLIFVAVISLMLCDKASALSRVGSYGSTWQRHSGVTVVSFKNNTNEVLSEWSEGVLHVNNTMVYCVQTGRKFRAGLTLRAYDAVSFFQGRFGLTKDEAQDLLTEIALYNDYLKSVRTDLTIEQRHFFGQTLIWMAVDNYANWEATGYWVDAGRNPSIFPCKEQPASSQCVYENTAFEQTIEREARAYYEKNKKKMKGIGVVWDNGSNQPLAELEVVPADYDYSYTASCADCENTNSDYLAYTIKDTSNWEAILASTSSSNSNVQGYFSQGSYGQGEVFCREEFSVYFPNARSQIYVEPGRYFVMNPEEEELNGLSEFGASPIPNLKPYKVYRKRECRAEVDLVRMPNETLEAYQARVLRAKRAALNEYEEDKKEDFAKNMGDVWFKYTETYEDSKYNMDEPDELQLYSVYESNPMLDYGSELKNVAADDAQLTMENTNQYKLPEEYYRYIRLRDGLSMSKVPSEPYKEVGIANLPVSFENHGVKIDSTHYKAADIQFAYDLPSNAMLGSAASNNGYLATSLGSGGSGGNCLAKSTITGSDPTAGYSCKILTSYLPTTPPDTDEGCESPEDAKKLGVDWNSKEGYCCPPGTQYNSKTGKCDSGSTNDDCNSPEDAERLGLDWNSKGSYCCPVGTKYNPSTGSCESEPNDPGDNDGCNSEEDASRLGVDWNPIAKVCCAEGTEFNSETGKCAVGNETEYVCPESDCPYGCCPSGECAPMPDGTCPGGGGIDVIYRTIDLEDPFPGQDAERRETGANWCNYNVKTHAIDCSYNNGTSNNYIIRSGNGHKVYDDDHVLYEITLDSQTIKTIRNYNDKEKYDNWDLECYKNGTRCKSNFLSSTVRSKMSGKCYNASYSNFYSCDKDV